MRTFIALDLSQEIRSELARLEEILKSAGADVKWVNPENIHLTLKFLGEIEENAVGEIKKALDGVASVRKAFGISLFKAGAFPSLDNPRVIWVGIDKGCAETEEIAKGAEEALEKLGFAKEERPFSAHLTIGRVRSGKNKHALKEKLASIAVRPATCAIKHVTLFQSTLTPKGPIYTALYTAEFKGM